MNDYKNNYPTLLIHGFAGWGEDDGMSSSASMTRCSSVPANCLTQRMSSDPAPNKNTKSLPYGRLSFHVC